MSLALAVTEGRTTWDASVSHTPANNRMKLTRDEGGSPGPGVRSRAYGARRVLSHRVQLMRVLGGF